MKLPHRTLVMLAISLCIISSSTFTASAHSGRTDGAGGHTDHDTGEYHYHHGYPAHDHYDMDGDGVDDCPYDFDDKTSQNSGSGSGGSYGGTTIKELEEEEVPDWVYWVIGILSISLLASIWINRNQSKEYAELTTRYKKDLETEKHHSVTALAKQETEHKREISALNTLHNEQITNLNLSAEEIRSKNTRMLSQIMKYHHRNAVVMRIVDHCINKDQRKKLDALLTDIDNGIIKIPDDVRFSDNGLPITGSVQIDKPYGDMTVYLAHRGSCYHTDRHCGTGMYDIAHAYFVIGKLPPCKKCTTGFPDMIPEWYIRLNDITNK